GARSLCLSLFVFVLLSASCPPSRSTLFPYTTLFRSERDDDVGVVALRPDERLRVGLAPIELRKHLVRPVAAPRAVARDLPDGRRSEEHTSELQSHLNLVCRLLLAKKKPLRGTHPPAE